MAGREIHVLVVDDSAVVREIMTRLLGNAPGFTCDTASDPIIAQQKVARQRPDVILLDVEMPRMDGITFLRQQMQVDPIPVIILSALTHDSSEIAVRALEEGAIDVLSKPKLGVGSYLAEHGIVLLDALRAASKARISPRRSPRRRSATTPAPPTRPIGLSVTTAKVIAVGASTGGTEALRDFLEKMPPDAPGIVIVQHMPEMFTRSFAERLNMLCTISVKEAENGDRITPGLALIAPGGRHTKVKRTGAEYITRIEEGPLVSRHRPSVDVLFSSVATACGENAVGVIMTGMGSDGAKGLLEMRQAGASTLAQDEASCVVFGMPQAAGNIGATDEYVPLGKLPQRVLSLLRRSGRSARKRKAG